jgi:hypothetical protein
MKIEIHPEKIIDVIEEGLGKGPLTIGIYCTKCNSQFELNKESVAMAVMFETTFIQYLKWIQQSECKKCGANDN